MDTARKVLDELRELMIEDRPEDWEMHKEELWEVYAAALKREMDENEEEGEEDEDEEDGDNDEERGMRREKLFPMARTSVWATVNGNRATTFPMRGLTERLP